MADAVYAQPNYLLTVEEKLAKRELKRLLKQQHRRQKLENRLERALSRGDEVVAATARLELSALLVADGFCCSAAACVVDLPTERPELVEARAYILQTYHTLQRSWGSTGRCDADKDDIPTHETTINHETPSTSPNQNIQTDDTAQLLAPSSIRNNPQYTDPTVKSARIASARALLQHMQKGTQALDMFDDPIALQGYTRHKFQSRASTVTQACVALVALDEAIHTQHATSSSSSNGTDTTTASINTTGVSNDSIRSMAHALLHTVRTVVSVGCGPGCDAVGVVGFLRAVSRHHSNGDDGLSLSPQSPLDRVVLLDYAMPQWRPIVSVVSNELIRTGMVNRVDARTCDVGQRWDEQSDDLADLERIGDRRPDATETTSTTLIVVSYLFSETRDRWHVLMDDLMADARVGTLFLLTDPTSWQLHVFRRRYESCLQHMWLDSSMYYPVLQDIEGRNGPAILMCVKVKVGDAS